MDPTDPLSLDQMRYLEAVMEAIADSTWYISFQENRVHYNRRWYEMLGYEPGSLPDSVDAWLDLVHSEDLPRVQADMAAHLEGRTTVFRNEHRLRTRSGHWLWVLDRGRILARDGLGRPLVAAGSHMDISLQKEAEQALQNKIRELDQIKFALDQSAIFALCDANGVIREVNDKFAEISGFGAKELIGRTHRMVRSGFHSEEFYRNMWDSVTSGQVWHGEICNRAKDGHFYWVDTTITPFLGADGLPEHYLSIRFDITERHRIEDELRVSQSLLVQAMEAIPGHFAIFDQQERLIRCNQKYQSLFPESDRTEILGKPYHGLVDTIFRSNLDLDEEALQEVFRERMCLHAHSGEKFEIRSKQGKVVRVEESSTPMGGFVVLGTDITEEVAREAAMRKARERAEVANVLKDQFVGFISHELRNPLQSILSTVDLLLSGPEPLDDRMRKKLLMVQECGNRQARIIEDLLDYASLASGKMTIQEERVSLAPLVVQAMESIHSQAERRQIQVKADLCEAIVRSDPHRLLQVFDNLLSNAVKYNREGGRIDVRIIPCDLEWVRVSVEDTGLGIPQELQAKVFQPYQRLGQEQGAIKGSGLGLNLTRLLVERMGGRIGFISREGSGSTFWVELPWVDPPPAA